MTPVHQVGERLGRTPPGLALVPVDTDHVALGWEGLETARAAITTMGSLLSSSAIPSLSTASESGARTGDWMG